VKAPFRPIGFLEKYKVPVHAGEGAVARAVDRTSRIDLEKAQTFKRGFLFLFFVPVLIGGLTVLYHGSRDLSQALTAANWPTAEGKIIESRAVVSGRKSGNYEPRVNYTYGVNGVPHGNSVVYPHWFWSRAATQKIVSQFRPGQTAEIHYDPDHPESAMLLPGAQRGVFQGVLVAGLLLSLALLLGVACFAPKSDIIQQGSTISYRAGTMESKLSGFALLGIIAMAVMLWWVA
jgi:hypothetical protein